VCRVEKSITTAPWSPFLGINSIIVTLPVISLSFPRAAESHICEYLHMASRRNS
jgi:hypothetical protein